MRNLIRASTKRFSLTDAMRSRVSTCLYQSYSEDEGLLGNLDRWTQQRVTDKNLAKLALVLDSDDPTETCYQYLIREIDAEAENGIYLVRSDSTLRHLRGLIDEPSRVPDPLRTSREDASQGQGRGNTAASSANVSGVSHVHEFPRCFRASARSPSTCPTAQ